MPARANGVSRREQPRQRVGGHDHRHDGRERGDEQRGPEGDGTPRERPGDGDEHDVGDQCHDPRVDPHDRPDDESHEHRPDHRTADRQRPSIGWRSAPELEPRRMAAAVHEPADGDRGERRQGEMGEHVGGRQREALRCDQRREVRHGKHRGRETREQQRDGDEGERVDLGPSRET